ncbi:MAG TPA: DUF192 domain-containing protein, partial [bacterium]|nr:DUF192 domain-containing protein [bacterium]
MIFATLLFSVISAEEICSYPAEAEITITSKTGNRIFFNVGIAETPAEHEKGLMHCPELKKGKGLFFIFNDDREH